MDVYVMPGVFGIANPPEADFKEIVVSLGGSLIKSLMERAPVTGAGADDEGTGTEARRGRVVTKAPTTQTKAARTRAPAQAQARTQAQAQAQAHTRTALRPLVVVSSDAAWKKAKRTEVAAIESTGVVSVVNSDCLFSGCVLHRVLDVTRKEYLVHTFHQPERKQDQGQRLESTDDEEEEGEQKEMVEPAPKRSSRRR
jgi:hypothetical protein